MSMTYIDDVIAFLGHKNVRIMGEVGSFLGAGFVLHSAYPFLPLGLVGFAVGPVKLAYVLGAVLVLVGLGFHRKAI